MSSPQHPAVIAPLQELAAAMELEDAFTGLCWSDARQVAATVAFDALTEDYAERVLRDRAQLILAGRGDQRWIDPAAVARALNIAATVLDIW